LLEDETDVAAAERDLLVSERPIGGTVVGSSRQPHGLQGGHGIPYDRHSGDDRVHAAYRQRDNEENDPDTHTRIARVVDQLILQVGAAETLRLLLSFSRDAPEVGREPFASARPTYESSFSGTAAVDQRRRRLAQDSIGSFAQRFPEALKIRIS
jgi:hypothetical protein